MTQTIETVPMARSSAVLGPHLPGIRAELERQLRFRRNQLNELAADVRSGLAGDDDARLQVSRVLQVREGERPCDEEQHQAGGTGVGLQSSHLTCLVVAFTEVHNRGIQGGDAPPRHAGCGRASRGSGHGRSGLHPDAPFAPVSSRLTPRRGVLIAAGRPSNGAR